MILKKLSELLIIIPPTVFGIYLIFSAQTIHAQSDVDSDFCPVVDPLEAQLSNINGVYEAEDTFSDRIIITNSTDYVLGGVRVAVAIFSSVDDLIPDYWTVLPGSHKYPPGANMGIPIDIGLEALPAGTYLLKPFAIQGDETALLGAAVRDSERTPGITVIKTTPAESDVSIELSINDSSFVGQEISFESKQPIEVSIKTINNNSEPMHTSHMLGVITQGDTPLGAAVTSDVLDSANPIPGSSRTTELIDRFADEGAYTVYSALVTEGYFQPIVSAPITIGEVKPGLSWAYVSAVGLGNYPLQVKSEVVACVDYVGFSRVGNNLPEELSVNFVITEADTAQVLASRSIKSTDIENSDFSFYPRIKSSNFIVETEFLQGRFNKNIVLESEDNSDQGEVSNLSVVDTMIHEFVCTDTNVCSHIIEKDQFAIEIVYADDTKSVWFYTGIVVASLLLMYILVGRLPKKKDSEVEEIIEPSNDKMQ